MRVEEKLSDMTSESSVSVDVNYHVNDLSRIINAALRGIPDVENNALRPLLTELCDSLLELGGGIFIEARDADIADVAAKITDNARNGEAEQRPPPPGPAPPPLPPPPRGGRALFLPPCSPPAKVV